MEKQIQELFNKMIEWVEDDYCKGLFIEEFKTIKNTPQTIEKNKTVLRDLFNECKNIDEFINVIAENFELK